MKLNPFKKKNANQDANPVLHGRLLHKLSSDPFVDWVIMLSFTIVLALALVGVGIYVYLGTGANLEAVRPSPKAAALPLDTAKLSSVLGNFDTKASRKDAILRAYTAPRDPSLP